MQLATILIEIWYVNLWIFYIDFIYDSDGF